MNYVIRYTETPDEIAANVAAVAESAGREYLDTLGCTPEEYVEGWSDLYVVTVKGAWSLGGVEPYEADTFDTREDAEAWLAKYGDTEPGTWEIMPL
jgi:hypothetical protein